MTKDSNKSYFQNWISVAGSIFSIIFFIFLIFLFVVDFLSKEENPYVQAGTYLIIPIFLILSLALIPVGAWRERRRLREYGIQKFPQIDFNNPLHQKWAFVTIAVGTLFLLFTAYGSYRAYQFTESVAFCGKMCHQVMDPEYTAYQNSPHARVACVQCHIGPGADWFVRSKLSGSYQIYSTLAKRYSRPIKTPIKNLRPAQETCEQCHWPKQFFGAIEQDHYYSLSDEKNTPWKTKMMMFVGGGNPPFGKKEGIHWHMSINNKIYYVPTDEKRQQIPWVKKVGPDGKEEIFIDEDSKFSETNLPKGEIRRLDCVDCHNRPSHIYHSPDASVNEMLAMKQIDPELPYIKREAIKVLTAPYSSKDEAAQKIRDSLESFYRSKYPEIFKSKQNEIKQAVDTVIQIYDLNFFPQMKVSWKEYPNNIGHFIFPGCFRCHDGKHKTVSGKAIPHKCNVCHSIISQGPLDVQETSVNGLEFKHPEDIGDSWQEMKCYDCHNGSLT